MFTIVSSWEDADGIASVAIAPDGCRFVGRKITRFDRIAGMVAGYGRVSDGD
jgi:hypothetical protein